MWRNGEVSGAGIQEIAETGAGDNFLMEVDECGDSCGDPDGFRCEPFSGMCDAVGEVRMTPQLSHLSAATMVAPSPDWYAFQLHYLLMNVFVELLC